MRYCQHARRMPTAAALLARSCSKAWRPTAACTCPSAIRRSTRRRWRAGATLPYADLAFEILSLLHRRHPGRRPARAASTRPTRARCSAATRSRRCARSSRACYLAALSNGPTLAFKDMAMQLLGNLFEYELARRGEHAQHPGRDLGRHRQRRRVRDARQARRARVHALAARPHEPVPAGADVRLQDANIHNIAIDGVFDDCQDIVKAVNDDAAIQGAAPHRRRQLDQLGARGGAGRLLLRRLLPATRAQRRAGRASPCRRATSATSAPATSRA